MLWKTNDKKKDIDYRNKIAILKKQFIEELDTIKSLSQADIKSWHNYLNSVLIIPVGEAQRKQAKAKGLNIPKTAFPSEYRAALVLLKKKTKAIIKVLSSDILAADDVIAQDKLEDFINKYLKKMVKKELKHYIDLSKPMVSVSNIFENASKSLNKYAPKEVGDKSYSIKCKTCGAARLEEDQYDECFYCGTPLFKK